MNIAKQTVFVIVLTAAFLLFNHPSRAQKDRVIKFGVLNKVIVTQKSLMSKDIARQISGRLKSFRAEIKSEEDVLRKANDELQKQRVILAPEAFQIEARKFRQKTAELQRKVQQRNQDFNRLRNFTNGAFNKEMNKALSDVTKKHKFTLVLRRREVLVRANFLDITPLVLTQINKNMPKFTIPDDINKIGK